MHPAGMGGWANAGDRGQRVHSESRPDPAGHGFCRTAPDGPGRPVRSRAGRTRQCCCQCRRLCHQQGRCLCLRRHAARPESCRMGDPRRPPMRAGRGPATDGRKLTPTLATAGTGPDPRLASHKKASLATSEAFFVRTVMGYVAARGPCPALIPQRDRQRIRLTASPSRRILYCGPF
ncbi:hypothetical protein SPHINGOR109_10210 [Sphingorhabdus sp. 109]|nr:hypothetical protein SPHINGOR109_10210 [Sphingorhabdus sp. 109]